MSADRTYPDRPYVGVGAVVWKDSKVLLIRRANDPGAGTWSLPGGTQEIGETIRETAIREVREETSVEIKNLRFLGAFDSIQHDEGGRVLYHYTLINYEAFWVSGDPKPGEAETEARFIAVEGLTDLDLMDPMLNIILQSAKRRA